MTSSFYGYALIYLPKIPLNIINTITEDVVPNQTYEKEQIPKHNKNIGFVPRMSLKLP